MIKYLNKNGLIGFMMAFMGFISFVSELKAQRKLQPRIIPPMDTNACYMIRWRVQNLVNSNTDNGLVFHQKGRSSDFYYWVTESGALVLFADSALSKPLAIEKRNGYAFNPWTAGKTFMLLLPKRTDAEGWIRCQWREQASNLILDEIWYCPMEEERKLTWIGWQPTGQANVVVK